MPLFNELVDKGSLKRGDYPTFLYDHICYETIMGSYAYGVSTDDSDKDIYAVGMPPKDYIFPHLSGYVPGFGKKSPPSFENYQKHHIDHNGSSIDYNCYSIVQYFHLLLDCNPNMIDSIFTPQHCIIYCNSIGTIIRENRKLFLHKGAWHRFKGYAFQSMHKMRTKNPIGKRKELVEKYGVDVKYMYHIVRLLNEVEQIMMEGDLDLHRNNDQLKAIRRGDWTEKQVVEYFEMKEKDLETLYIKSELPKYPDEDKIKKVLLDCLEIAYNDVKKIVDTSEQTALINDLKELVKKYS